MLSFRKGKEGASSASAKRTFSFPFTPRKAVEQPARAEPKGLKAHVDKRRAQNAQEPQRPKSAVDELSAMLEEEEDAVGPATARATDVEPKTARGHHAREAKIGNAFTNFARSSKARAAAAATHVTCASLLLLPAASRTVPLPPCLSPALSCRALATLLCIAMLCPALLLVVRLPTAVSAHPCCRCKHALLLERRGRRACRCVRSTTRSARSTLRLTQCRRAQGGFCAAWC